MQMGFEIFQILTALQIQIISIKFITNVLLSTLLAANNGFYNILREIPTCEVKKAYSFISRKKHSNYLSQVFSLNIPKDSQTFYSALVSSSAAVKQKCIPSISCKYVIQDNFVF